MYYNFPRNLVHTYNSITSSLHVFQMVSDIRFRPLFIRYDRKTSAGMTAYFALPDELNLGSHWESRSRLECASLCATWINCNGVLYNATERSCYHFLIIST